jgi:hypothetical protein
VLSVAPGQAVNVTISGWFIQFVLSSSGNEADAIVELASRCRKHLRAISSQDHISVVVQ